jgi:hypothetical protein
MVVTTADMMVWTMVARRVCKMVDLMVEMADLMVEMTVVLTASLMVEKLVGTKVLARVQKKVALMVP